jgi:RNA polymerase sigma-70 factor (ECF subfamily)
MAGPRGEDEAALIARLKRREEAAFRQVVARWHGTLVSLAATVLRDRGLAEEVAQDTWLAVVTAIDGFEGRSALSSWLAAIALNKARTRARRDGRIVYTADLDAPAAAGPAVDLARFKPDGHWAEPPAVWDVLDPERIVAGRELLAHIRAAIDALPEGQRAVVVLRDVEGLEADEICRLLEITPVHQRLLLHRARAKLRATIEALIGEGARDK